MNKYKILNILSNTIGISIDDLLTLPEDTLLSGMGLSSISCIQFIVALEETFDFEVLDSDLLLSNFETLGKLFSTLQKYLDTSYTAKKVLICDCDNCLWHGIAGEEEIYIDSTAIALQHELIHLYQSGVLLCLCSKNDPQNIKTAFGQPGMLLQPEHILISKVNRNSKAENIREIAKELNLSTDSFVFVDDSDYELGLIRALYPEIDAVKVDFSTNTFIDEIHSSFRHDTVSTDFNRTAQYREQKKREKDKLLITDVEEYNASLQTIVTCERAGFEQADRIAELSQRTNQCNLSCARYAEADITRLLSDENYTLLSLSVQDKYGDMGVVGAAAIRQDNNPVIEAFFLSCRAFDRHFEDVLIEKAKSLFPSGLSGIYVKSDKNIRFETFYTKHGVPQYGRD